MKLYVFETDKWLESDVVYPHDIALCLQEEKKRIYIYQEQTSPILRYYKEKNTPFVISSITKLDTPPEPVVHEILQELKKRKLI